MQRIESLHFKADATKILSALAIKWRINIVMPDEIKSVVTVDLTDVTVERAIQIVAAKAGAVYRRIDNDFVVAAPERITQILETLGKQERFMLHAIPASEAIAQLKQATPYVTVRPFGRALTLIGAPSDLIQAHELLRQLDTPPNTEPSETVSLSLKHAPPAEVQQVLTVQFPQLKAQKVGEELLAITGPGSEVTRAMDLARELDRGSSGDALYVVYQVKYGSARALAMTLQRFTPRVTVVVGPEPYHIPGSTINLANTSSAGSAGLNGTTGAGTSSTGSLSSGGISDSQSTLNDNGQTGGGAGGNQQGGERATNLILGGTAENVQAALKLLSSIDVATPQVVLDVKVVSTNPQVTENLGIDWSNGGQGQAASITGSVSEIANASGSVHSLSIGQLGRLPISFTATLNAFIRRDDVRVLAKPTITALNNETGIVFVGETRRVQVASVVPNSGANNIILNNVEEIPVGVALQMRPRVNGNDQVTLFLHPIYSTGGATDPNTGLFSTFQREAATTVRVKNGETVVIGGLLQDEDTKTLIKVPLLGDLPVVGQFFRNHSRTHLRREVLVFITTHILND
jgi:type II secretory pathway component GspD/PulD (secretin)